MSNLFSRVYRKSNYSKISILGILGSPRQGGNSDILLDKALEGAQRAGAEIEKIIINNFSFLPCQSCEDIRDDGYCLIGDDFQKIYTAINSANAVLVASPIFFGSVSAQVKMMIDRFQCHWRAKNVLKNISSETKKQGGFICVAAGTRGDFFKNARLVVKNFFAAAGIAYTEELFCPGVDEKGSIMQFPKILQKAAALGERLGQG